MTPSRFYVAAVAMAGWIVACTVPTWKHHPDGPVVPGSENVRVQFMSQKGDSWLYEHCVYKGFLSAPGPQTARGRALEKGANFVEPLVKPGAGVIVDETDLMDAYVAFDCPSPPPDTLE